ncbi:MAG: hypothetical protein ACUVX9_07790 [Anaerolineae bacterium]
MFAAAGLCLDWLQARFRLDDITIEGWLDPPEVTADGKDSTVLTVRVTERGQPRARVLLQSWLQSGNGLLIPEWVYTDESGIAQITYTPNPMTPYDIEQDTIIHLIDTHVGRIIEVDKHFIIEVPVKAP